MKDKLFYILKLLSVPLILITIYLLMYIIWKLLGLPSDNVLIEIIKGAFEKYGLWIVFVSALVEGFLLLGQYFPGGTVIFLGVISAGKDIPRALEVVTVVTISFIISYTLNYLVGKYGWYKLLVKFGLSKSLEDSKQKLENQGLNAVIFSYWEPNLASITATAAGILKISMKKFQIYSVGGVIMWNIFWGTLVFSLGNAALNLIGLKFVFIIFVIWVAILLVKDFFMNMIERLAKYFYLPKFRKLEHKIGCKLIFHNIPNRYINGLVGCDMTGTWKKFGLKIENGANYFTIGHVVNGVSSRFDPKAPEYQSWLGGYTVKFASGQIWTPEDHFKLAIADQNSWLKNWYGDPNPRTNTKGWNLIPLDNIQIGRYLGQLYEFGCTTDDDVGIGYKAKKLRLASVWMAALLNLSNPNLKLKGSELRPKISDNVYERLKLLGYIAIFDIKPNVKVVLYGNGIVDTFEKLKADLLSAIKMCEIIEI